MSTFPASGAMSTAIDPPHADLAGPLEVIWYLHTVKRSWPVRRPLFDRVGSMVRSWAFYPGTGSGSGSPPGQAGVSPSPPSARHQPAAFRRPVLSGTTVAAAASPGSNRSGSYAREHGPRRLGS